MATKSDLILENDGKCLQELKIDDACGKDKKLDCKPENTSVNVIGDETSFDAFKTNLEQKLESALGVTISCQGNTIEDVVCNDEDWTIHYCQGIKLDLDC